MDATNGDDVTALLAHLARLRHADVPAGTTSAPPRSLRWAKQVYNAAVRLQFCFVYPDTEIADGQLGTDLGRALEHLIERAANAVVPLRVQENRAKLDELLDRETSVELDDAISELLAVADAAGWGMGATPADPSDLERGVDIVAKLAAWHQGLRAGESRERLVTPGKEPSVKDESKAEFIASLATKLAVDRSPVIAQIPPKNARLVRDVAKALFRQTVSDLGDDQRLQAMADNLRRSQVKEGG